ncbi:MAG: hypothetical protein RBT30_00465 [Patescibacteria group bacterium]|jgi:hypothetical protein|nr:hypothetical protein [Patescibacteria group bacterium]
MKKNKNQQQLIKELEIIFQDSENKLSVLHQQKLALINQFKKAQDENMASNILKQIKELK